MIRWAILFAVVLAVSSTPTKCRNEGECLEERIHPDLPEPPQGRATDLDDSENKQTYWLNNAQDFVKTVTKRERNLKKAKNVIFFIGDGMGLATLAAARALKGGEEMKLAFEDFPDVGLAKTYSLDYIVPDSASTATAYLGGVKGNYYTVGVNGHVKKNDCEAMQVEANHVESIAQWAIDDGKSAGIVTTTRVTHASPAGTYAHTAHRDWESDSFIKKNCGADSKAQDIAYQLVHGKTGSEFKVIFGGGRREFVDKTLDKRGIRTDGKDLMKEWVDAKPNSKFIETLTDFHNLDVDQVDRVMGLFQDSHMLYHLNDTEKSQPTLEQMTMKAIQMLAKDDEGYFLFVEGGKIDLAHHDTQAQIALDETLEFSKAVDMALKITDDETLIVISSDHSHTFSVAGYPNRHNDIFGFGGSRANDGNPYMTLSYANGPSYDTYFDTKKNERIDPSKVKRDDPAAFFPATFDIDSETHGGEDVAVFAKGPFSHLFTGVYEQNTIPHLMAYAACWNKHFQMCDKLEKP